MDTVQNKNLDTMELVDILKALPHRYPFLMIDRIIECDGDESAIGIKNITMNEPQFLGHFPGNPVMPGVLLVEGMAQTAGAICVKFVIKSDDAPLVYFLTIDKVKFRKPVVPGDRVEFHMKKLARRNNIWRYQGQAKVDGQIVCEAELGAMVVVPDKKPE